MIESFGLRHLFYGFNVPAKGLPVLVRDGPCLSWVELGAHTEDLRRKGWRQRWFTIRPTSKHTASGECFSGIILPYTLSTEPFTCL